LRLEEPVEVCFVLSFFRSILRLFRELNGHLLLLLRLLSLFGLFYLLLLLFSESLFLFLFDILSLLWMVLLPELIKETLVFHHWLSIFGLIHLDDFSSLLLLFLLKRELLILVKSHDLERGVGTLVDIFGLAWTFFPALGVDLDLFHVLRPVGAVNSVFRSEIDWLLRNLIQFLVWR
jgi:hypothetical protein